MSPTLYTTFTNASEITPYVEFIKKQKEIETDYTTLGGVSFLPVKINYIIYGFVRYEDSYKLY